MNNLQRDKRHLRGRKAHLEYLDARIVPAVVHPTVAVAADMASPSMHSRQPTENIVAGESAIQIRHEQRMVKLAERREAALEQRAARFAARHHITLAAPVQDQVIAVPSTTSTPATPSTTAQGTSGSSASSPATGSSAGSTSDPSPPSPVKISAPVVVVNPLPSNVSSPLDTVYEEYENGTLPSGPGKPGQVQIQGSNVGVQIQTSNPSEFNTLVANAESLGLQVTDVSAAYDIVVGFLPIAELPSAAQLAGSPSITPLTYPELNLN